MHEPPSYALTNSLRDALRQAAEAADTEALRVILGLEATPNGTAWRNKAADYVGWPPVILREETPGIDEYLDAYRVTCRRYGIAGRPLILTPAQ